MNLLEDLVAWLADLEELNTRGGSAAEHEALMARKVAILDRIRAARWLADGPEGQPVAEPSPAGAPQGPALD